MVSYDSYEVFAMSSDGMPKDEAQLLSNIPTVCTLAS